MKSQSILIIFVISFLSVTAFSAGTVYDTQSPYYIKSVQIMKRALMRGAGAINASSEEIPTSTEEAGRLFKKVCEPTIDNYNYQKSVEVQSSDSLLQMNFQCRTRDILTGVSETIQFVASINEYNSLVDLQILNLKAQNKQASQPTYEQTHHVFIAVAAGTLASGLLAKGIYPDQHDKVLHAIVGSLISASTALFAHYKFDYEPTKSMWIGIATSVVAGILKEVYDGFHKDKHTVDSRDAAATAVGGVAGGVTLRFQFSF